VIGCAAEPPAICDTVADYPADLPDSAAMERTLAGMLFLVAAVAFSIAAGAWWMQRVCFTPDDTRDTAAAMLEEPDIRGEIEGVLSQASAPVLGVNAPELSTFLETQILSTHAGAAVMGPIMKEIHDKIIGNRDDDITVTGEEMIPIVRDQRAADVEKVILPIPVIGTLNTTRTTIGWLIPIAAGIGAIAMLLGIATRPERRDVLRGLGEFFVAMACSMIVFGYLLPVQLLPAIDNGVWTKAIPRLALRTLPFVLGSAAIFGLGGAALILASMSGGKRRQFSTPLSVSRYRGDEAGWS
jgi:hypothetical protein